LSGASLFFTLPRFIFAMPIPDTLRSLLEHPHLARLSTALRRRRRFREAVLAVLA
jgi:hypothetical protein